MENLPLSKRKSSVNTKREVANFLVSDLDMLLQENIKENGNNEITLDYAIMNILQNYIKKGNLNSLNHNKDKINFTLECELDLSNNLGDNKNSTVTFRKLKEDSYFSTYFKAQEHIHPFFTADGEESLINYFPHSPYLVKQENTPKELDIHSLIRNNSNNNISLDKNINNKDNVVDSQVLIFSPHQDDEVLGAAALINKLVINNIDFKVIYMTSGKGGGNSNTRQIEAINGIKVLGGNEDNCVFYDFPFYRKPNREVTQEDTDFMSEIMKKYNPGSMFIIGDVFDPNNTHRKCYDILLHYLHNYNDDISKIPNSTSTNLNDLIYKEIINKNWPFKVFFYYSVWYWPKENEVTHINHYDITQYKKKVCAMMEHTSQIQNKFMGADERPFYERATHRDKWFGSKYEKDYCEIFYLLNDGNQN